MILREGENIKIVQDGEDFFIHAPALNKMVLKHGPFTVSGPSVELLAGEHIQLSSAHPDKFKISVNIDKEKARIADLELRIGNLEKVIVSLLKEKEQASGNQ